MDNGLPEQVSDLAYKTDNVCGGDDNGGDDNGADDNYSYNNDNNI